MHHVKRRVIKGVPGVERSEPPGMRQRTPNVFSWQMALGVPLGAHYRVAGHEDFAGYVASSKAE